MITPIFQVNNRSLIVCWIKKRGSTNRDREADQDRGTEGKNGRKQEKKEGGKEERKKEILEKIKVQLN